MAKRSTKENLSRKKKETCSRNLNSWRLPVPFFWTFYRLVKILLSLLSQEKLNEAPKSRQNSADNLKEVQAKFSEEMKALKARESETQSLLSEKIAQLNESANEKQKVQHWHKSKMKKWRWTKNIHQTKNEEMKREREK